MSSFAEDEVALPYSPTHTGRRAKIGYLGIEGANFNDLWPLFAGTALSVALLLAFFIGGWWVDASGATRAAVGFLPGVAGYGYLRLFVQGRPPHYRGDLWTTLCAVRLDFDAPDFSGNSVLPVRRVVLGWRPGPTPGDRCRHPLRPVRSEFGGKSHG